MIPVNPLLFCTHQTNRQIILLTVEVDRCYGSNRGLNTYEGFSKKINLSALEIR